MGLSPVEAPLTFGADPVDGTDPGFLNNFV